MTIVRDLQAMLQALPQALLRTTHPCTAPSTAPGNAFGMRAKQCRCNATRALDQTRQLTETSALVLNLRDKTHETQRASCGPPPPRKAAFR